MNANNRHEYEHDGPSKSTVFRDRLFSPSREQWDIPGNYSQWLSCNMSKNMNQWHVLFPSTDATNACGFREVPSSTHG
jgi:hypothetical protein